MCWHTMKKESSIHIETGRTSIDSWIAKEKIVTHLVRKCSKFDFQRCKMRGFVCCLDIVVSPKEMYTDEYNLDFVFSHLLQILSR